MQHLILLYMMVLTNEMIRNIQVKKNMKYTYPLDILFWYNW